MSAIVTDLSAPRFPRVVGASIATTPTHLATEGGDTIVIPRPDNTVEGNVMLAWTGGTSAIFQTIPSGWIEVSSTGGGPGISRKLWSKVATDSEPDSYTWTLTPNDTSRSGLMISVAGAQSTFQTPVKTNQSSVTTIGLAAMPKSKPGGVLALYFVTADELAVDSSSGLTVGAQHLSTGTAPYSFKFSTVCLYEAIEKEETISGRTATMEEEVLTVYEIDTIAFPN